VSGAESNHQGKSLTTNKRTTRHNFDCPQGTVLFIIGPKKIPNSSQQQKWVEAKDLHREQKESGLSDLEKCL